MRLDDWPGSGFENGLLIDSNLLVLFTVGTVNPVRIPSFKRTSRYDRDAFDLLVRVMSRYDQIYTVAHVMAEVSNLTDLNGQERLQARRILATTVALFEEPHVASSEAAGAAPYEDLGLADSAISIVARQTKCSVLTDDLGLYLSLLREDLPAVNFTHLRQSSWQSDLLR